MTTARYAGPERREDGMLDLRDHIDARLEEHKKHFDERIDTLSLKVDPMHEYFVTAKTGAAIIKWLFAILGSLGGAWVVLKGWLPK